MSAQFCSLAEELLGSFKLIRLKNGLVQADILPELGGKIWSLRDVARSKEWLWHNPHVALQRVEFGANYDDNWSGGWEELFPNDAAGEFMGKALPDHGEWWNQPWQWEIIERNPRHVEVRLWRQGLVTHTQFEKWISLEANTAQLAVRYRITNLASESLYFLFKQHLAIAVTPSHKLELPGGKVTPVDLGFSTRIGASGPFDWPIAKSKSGEVVDLSSLPPKEEKHREFVYLAELPEGWCGVRDMDTGAALRFYFSREIFPYTWLFMTFGGWRDLYTVVLEPCTNMPKDLRTAYDLGQCAVLSPQAVMDCEVRAEICAASEGYL